VSNFFVRAYHLSKEKKEVQLGVDRAGERSTVGEKSTVEERSTEGVEGAN